MSLRKLGKQEPTAAPTPSSRKGEEGVVEDRKEKAEASKQDNEVRKEEKAAEETTERSHAESKAEEEEKAPKAQERSLEESQTQETEEVKEEAKEAKKEETEEVEEDEGEEEEAGEEDEATEASKEDVTDASKLEAKEVRKEEGTKDAAEEQERDRLDSKREADSDLAVQIYTPKKRRRVSLAEPLGSEAADAAEDDVKGAHGQASSSSSSAAPSLEPPLVANDWLAGSRGHYDVLGIARTADLAAVRKAYRRQALRTHPDKGGDTKDFLRVIGAFEVLSDRSRRAAYDADLDRQCCRDGQSVQQGAEEPEAPEDQPVLKEVLSEARAAHISLMDSDPGTWHRQIGELSTAVLEALQGLPQLLEAGRKHSSRNRDSEDFPREIAPPDGLPQGWKCVEYMYHSGKSAGLTYVRYHSPWGKKRFQSIPSAIKADADWRHVDASQAIAQMAKRKVTKQPPGPEPRGASAQQRPVQRGIYTVRNAANVSKYWVNVNWAYFRVYTRRTTSLAEAVDWHIAISNAKEVALSRMRSQQGSKGGLATPMTRKELLELVQSEPGLNLIFSSNFSKGSMHNIYTPSTEDLETAVLIHQRFNRLLEQGRYSMNIINEERQRAFQEISARGKELSILQCKLADAVAKELKRRRAAAGLAIAASPETPREKLPAPAREETALALIKPDERMGRQESSPSCSKDALAGAKKDRRDTEANLARRDPAADAQALVPTSSPASGTGASSSSRARPPHDKPDKRSAVQVALDFQNALGVDRKEAALLARAARALPPGEAKRRLAMLLQGSPRACQLLGLAGSSLLVPTAAQQQRRRATAGGSGRARSRGRSGEPQRLALRGPSPARRGPGPAPQQQQQQQQQLALPAPSAEPLALGPPESWNPPDGALLTSWWFLGLPAGIAPVPWLDLVELCRFRAGCRGARASADGEFKDRFRHFKYVPGFMEPPLQLTRSGRPIVTNFTATGCAAERVLVRFLAKPHHARIFEEMDLSQAPHRALENHYLQGALNCMPYLKRIVIPWHGWSTSVARRCFLRALPSRTSFESIDARGSVIERGRGEE